MTKVEFLLRTDTQNYRETKLQKFKDVIIDAIDEFNNKISRNNDNVSINLVEIKEKSFIIQLNEEHNLNLSSRSFVTTIGSLSKYLKNLGMDRLLSPQNKLFFLKTIEDSKIRSEDNSNTLSECVYVDYIEKTIYIPKQMTAEYVIKFYEEELIKLQVLADDKNDIIKYECGV